jgi:hypothetical protein
VQTQVKKLSTTCLLFLALFVRGGTLNADSSPEALCQTLYSDSLNRAKKALLEGKRDEAVRFLVEAATITEQCASLPEPHRGREPKENVLASAPSANQVSARVFL